MNKLYVTAYPNNVGCIESVVRNMEGKELSRCCFLLMMRMGCVDFGEFVKDHGNKYILTLEGCKKKNKEGDDMYGKELLTLLFVMIKQRN